MRGGGYVVRPPALISEIECPPHHKATDNDYSSAEIKTLDKIKVLLYLIHYY